MVKKLSSLMATRIIPIFMFLLVVIHSQNAEAASAKYRPYDKILNKPVIDMYGGSHTIDTFALLDINNDGKKELFVSWFRSIQVYTLQGKRAILLREFNSGMSVSYNKSRKALIVFTHGGTGMGGYIMCNAKSQKLKTIRNIYTHGGFIGEKYVQYYYINGKSVSEAKYLKYRSKYFVTTKNRFPTWYQNTASNRSKYLK